MSRMSFAKRLAVMLTVGGFLMGTAGNSYGASRVNLDRNDTVYNNVSEYFEPVKSDYQYQDDAVKIGYIVVGDDEMLLDDQTMGYIRRMLNAKFPGTRYPTKRITDEHMKYEMGRRNFGDKYVVTEAHDVLMKEFEKLENMYERIPVYGQKDTEQWQTNYTNYDTNYYGSNYSSNVSTGEYNTNHSAKSQGENDPLGNDNSYNFTKHLSTLPKEDYVRFARELQAQGMSDYDYILMFNIHSVNQQVKKKFISASMWSDFRITVRAINVNTGEYIDRAEYLKRGYSGSDGLFNSPSWRRGMRRAIVDGMVECFDNIPIGKYSVCDNPYCPRRQEELRTQEVFGKINRHCVKHCHDKTVCYDHMVDYTHDADLPGGYIDHSHEHID
ncbi:MAG: hypothetical protein MR553_03525 [Veillonellaceae bacterium]|nr:hypothetical protein [Veillonellaceae bacterium]MDD7656059.1 hypothetical protein [Veillonellaceae bacterium]